MVSLSPKSAVSDSFGDAENENPNPFEIKPLKTQNEGIKNTPKNDFEIHDIANDLKHENDMKSTMRMFGKKIDSLTVFVKEFVTRNDSASKPLKLTPNEPSFKHESEMVNIKKKVKEMEEEFGQVWKRISSIQSVVSFDNCDSSLKSNLDLDSPDKRMTKRAGNGNKKIKDGVGDSHSKVHKSQLNKTKEISIGKQWAQSYKKVPIDNQTDPNGRNSGEFSVFDIWKRDTIVDRGDDCLTKAKADKKGLVFLQNPHAKAKEEVSDCKMVKIKAKNDLDFKSQISNDIKRLKIRKEDFK